MTRNVKRFLGVALLSLAPSAALAGQVDFGFPDFLTQRNEYVSVREGAVELPVGRGESVASAGPALENIWLENLSTSTLSLGLQVITNTFNGVFAPYPCPPGSLFPSCGFQVSAPTPGVPPAAPVVQQYYWTDTPTNPAAGKTCVWRLEVVSDAAGNCSGTVFFGTYGGAVCTVNTTQSIINQLTCQVQLVTDMQ